MSNHYLSRRALVALAVIALASCSSDGTTTAVNGNLDGPWSSHDFNIGVVLNLTWTADSVKGSGTYTVLQNSLGCGGGTLDDDGTVTFAASISNGNIVGHMAFDAGWTPPYRGTLEGTTIDGAFQSIDAGPCFFPLYKGLVP